MSAKIDEWINCMSNLLLLNLTSQVIRAAATCHQEASTRDGTALDGRHVFSHIWNHFLYGIIYRAIKHVKSTNSHGSKWQRMEHDDQRIRGAETAQREQIYIQPYFDVARHHWESSH